MRAAVEAGVTPCGLRDSSVYRSRMRGKRWHLMMSGDVGLTRNRPF